MKPTRHGSRRHALLIFPLLILPLFIAPPSAANSERQTYDAREPAAPNDSGTLRFNVTVIGAKGGYITGLTKDDFSVWEDKTEREITYFRSDDLPLSVGILIDVSGSVGARTLAAAKHAVVRFLERGHRDNEYFVGEFNEGRRELVGWTRDVQEILQSLNKLAVPPHAPQAKIRPRGQTAFYDACAVALEEVARRPNRKHVLLLITDGLDNHSRLTLDQLRRKVKESDAQIYGLGIIEPDDHSGLTPVGLAILEVLTADSGGTTYVTDDKKELDKMVERIATELRHQYVIGFTPTNAAPSGKWNKVKIKVTPSSSGVSLKGSRVRSREGYFSPAATPAP